jgi:hypothetical protein
MLYVLLILSVCCCLLAAAEHAGAQPTNTNAVAAAKAVLPPVPSLVAVETFRKILSLKAEEREKFLATRTPEQRQVVELKLREYEAMPEEAREQRLRELQLRLYVRHMIKVPGSNRIDYLKQLGPAERELVEARLREWDELPAEARQRLLNYELIIRHVARGLTQITPPFPRPDRGLTDWGELSADKKQEIVADFERFFEELDERQRGQVLNVLSDRERQQMRVSLQSFERLPKDKRDRCLQAYKKFANLTEEERAKFLMNVNHWQNMTPKERESWRWLVSKITLLSSPVMPPGAKKLPPLPPAPTLPALPSQTGTLVVTND